MGLDALPTIAAQLVAHGLPASTPVALIENGTTDRERRVVGTLATIDSLQVGNIVARHIDAVVAPGLGETNVLGMNFLSRLSGWRVEGREMILVPHHPVGEGNEAKVKGE